ncbi:SMI1/KNR4 family protein [Jeotgalibacillus sp. S-D1]|uniref:SMI1/KNR4 family protein n=1 Tax=Jeotgalibacillus sp. S-D1 TaxID=2552189 RepID=UPI001F0E6AB2|nr:SMI1/KNR4 family protein [Jeotgalibacillus sp. S-D1]
MKIKRNSILQNPTDKRISAFENYCRVTLPTTFVDFIESYNGSIPITNNFPHEDYEILIERFLCLLNNPQDDDENGWYDIEVVLSQIDTRLTDNEDLIGAELIPYAELFVGDYVCLDFREKKRSFYCGLVS